MATQLTFRRGTSEPTQASGLTLGEPAFNTALSTFHIGRGTGVTAAWVGARISSLSADIAAGLTMQVPTMSAVKDYVASTTSGVATLNGLTGTVTLAAGTNIGVTTASGSITVTNLGVQTFNGATGAVQGVSSAVAGTGISVSGSTGAVTITNTGVTRAVAGTGISVSGATGSVTITNIGVQSFNGNTGAVTGASLGANTFTALNTFNAGISAAGGVTFASDIRVNSMTVGRGNPGVGDLYNTAVGFEVLSVVQVDEESTQGVLNTGLGYFSLNVLNYGSYNTALGAYSLYNTYNGGYNTAVGSNSLRNTTSGSLNTAIGYASINANVSGTENVGIGSSVLQGITQSNYNTAIGYAAGYFRGSGVSSLTSATGGIYLGHQARGSTNGQTNEIVIGRDALGLGSNTTVLGATTAVSATIYGLVNAPSGISAAGATFSGNIFAPNIVNSFNGSTGAVQGVSAAVAGTGISVSGATGAVTITNIGVQSFNGATGAVTGASLGANTFTGLNTFNAGISANSLYAFGITFGNSISSINPLYFNLDSDNFTLLNLNGSRIQMGWTAGANIDISNDGESAVRVAGILDVAGGVTFASTTNHTGAARFASTIVSTGSITANGGLTASTLDVSGAARLASTLAVTGVLTQSGGATFASTTDHTGAARFASTIVSTGSVTANGGLTASTLDVSGAARTTGDVTVGATLTVNGNFFVTGTVTTVNRTDLAIDDKIITLGRTLGSDALATDGGLSLSGTAARTWTWSNTRSAWESNQGVNVASTYGYAVNGTSVLTSSTLGSGVTTSSLQSLGTIGTGVWQATAIGATYGGTGLTSYTIGDVIYASGTSSLAKLGGVTAGYLLSANGTGTAPEYKQLLVKDGGGTSIATITSASGTLSAAIQYATASLKGVASFDNTNFTVSTGAVTITGVDGGTY